MKIDVEVINEIHNELVLSFNQVDTILKELNVPMDISKIIFSYSEGVCEDCKDCCKICSVFCYLGECREYNRRICIKYLAENRINQYKLLDKKTK